MYHGSSNCVLVYTWFHYLYTIFSALFLVSSQAMERHLATLRDNKDIPQHPSRDIHPQLPRRDIRPQLLNKDIRPQEMYLTREHPNRGTHRLELHHRLATHHNPVYRVISNKEIHRQEPQVSAPLCTSSLSIMLSHIFCLVAVILITTYRSVIPSQ